MASEITITAKLKAAKGQFDSTERAKTDLTFTWTGTNMRHCVQTVGSEAEALNIPEGTPGWCWLFNQDSTAVIQVKANTADDANAASFCAKMPPLSPALFHLDTSSNTTYSVIGNTASQDLEIFVLEV